ncbi:heterokaryon incompatibility protein-domain-containing protein [Corynascus novoguineensis]|uniref:Heterokaryon incompatibility protein-domain-containing protein n=1 Tax=Corynascus novoguineensis TaxID=1126955 RepID=A0AAN7CKL0_9PEZI|nr:heterokaryon incompatibility protein-domain-containing protein [Corynascus novoguineensis]
METLESQSGYLHSENLESLIRSADGCALCDLILRQMCIAVKYHVQSDEEIIDAREASKLFASFMADKHQLFMLDPTPVILRLDDTRGSLGARYVAIGTVMLESLDEPSKFRLALFWGRLLLHDNGDNVEPLKPRGSEDEVLGRLADWLRERESEVPRWSNAGDDKPLPTRVLDLGCFGDAQAGASAADVRLFEPAVGQCGRYVALSYCWGGYTECRTLKANLAERLERIQLCLLPELFAQAVKVTRGLGIRYLWIDALCIIQDDAEDWRREATTMCEVYWNAVCRLAVTDSKRPTEGFFPPSPILASVRVPSLEREAQRQGKNEDSRYSPMAREDGHEEGEKVEVDDGNAILTPSAQTRRIGVERDEDLQTYQDDTGKPREGTPSLPRGRDEYDGQTLPDDLDGFMSKFENMLQEMHSQEHEQEPHDYVPSEIYLTLPRAYSVDVDRGHLNTRGWVLQERSGFTPVDLFPERRFNSIEHMKDNNTTGNVWWQRATYGHSESHFVADPWLRICEIFSKCRFTYATDKLAAIAGLVKKKQEFAQSGNAQNFLGLWEESLHVELAWAPRAKTKLKFLRSLNLPSWAWIAYEGHVSFTKETRHTRDPSRVHIPPMAEFHLVETDVPDRTTQLPLAKPASLTVEITVRKLDRISAETTKSWEFDTMREELEGSSPFHLDPRSRTMPILLSALSVCQKILDSDRQVVGFLSFDEDVRHTGDLFCAHISTLLDESKNEYWRKSDTPILAYALVLVKVDGTENEYSRVGLAQVNHGWITSGARERMKLV